MVLGEWLNESNQSLIKVRSWHLCKETEVNLSVNVETPQKLILTLWCQV
jgi:hypothetical protein